VKLLYRFFIVLDYQFFFRISPRGGGTGLFDVHGRTDNHHETNTRFTGICVVPDIIHSVVYSIEQSNSTEANILSVVKKFPAMYETRKFITAVTIARHLSLSWAISILSMPPHPTSWRSILIVNLPYSGSLTFHVPNIIHHFRCTELSVRVWG